MDSADILESLELLESEIDGLEESLSPLLKTELSHLTSKLPVLDRAKFFVLITYAIESILFSYLNLNSVKAREHPVFRELARVRQYFEKIKSAENTVPTRGALTLDKAAAGRIISAGLGSSSKHDLEKVEQLAKEKAQAQLKSHRKPQISPGDPTQSGSRKKRKADAGTSDR